MCVECNYTEIARLKSTKKYKFSRIDGYGIFCKFVFSHSADYVKMRRFFMILPKKNCCFYGTEIYWLYMSYNVVIELQLQMNLFEICRKLCTSQANVTDKGIPFKYHLHFPTSIKLARLCQSTTLFCGTFIFLLALCF